jgi:hypothetical protein
VPAKKVLIAAENLTPSPIKHQGGQAAQPNFSRQHAKLVLSTIRASEHKKKPPGKSIELYMEELSGRLMVETENARNNTPSTRRDGASKQTRF